MLVQFLSGDFPQFKIVRTVFFFSETDFRIIRTPGSIFIFYLFELKGNLPYNEAALLGAWH